MSPRLAEEPGDTRQSPTGALALAFQSRRGRGGDAIVTPSDRKSPAHKPKRPTRQRRRRNAARNARPTIPIRTLRIAPRLPDPARPGIEIVDVITDMAAVAPVERPGPRRPIFLQGARRQAKVEGRLFRAQEGRSLPCTRRTRIGILVGHVGHCKAPRCAARQRAAGCRIDGGRSTSPTGSETPYRKIDPAGQRTPAGFEETDDGRRCFISKPSGQQSKRVPSLARLSRLSYSCARYLWPIGARRLFYARCHSGGIPLVRHSDADLGSGRKED